jgi:hypothetical protein
MGISLLKYNIFEKKFFYNEKNNIFSFPFELNNKDENNNEKTIKYYKVFSKESKRVFEINGNISTFDINNGNLYLNYKEAKFISLNWDNNNFVPLKLISYNIDKKKVNIIYNGHETTGFLIFNNYFN